MVQLHNSHVRTDVLPKESPFRLEATSKGFFPQAKGVNNFRSSRRIWRLRGLRKFEPLQLIALTRKIIQVFNRLIQPVIENTKEIIALKLSEWKTKILNDGRRVIISYLCITGNSVFILGLDILGQDGRSSNNFNMSREVTLHWVLSNYVQFADVCQHICKWDNEALKHSYN